MPLGFAQTTQISQEMRQQMRISPQMRQAFEILELPLQDLRAKIREELERNPVVEEARNRLGDSIDAQREAFAARGDDGAVSPASVAAPSDAEPPADEGAAPGEFAEMESDPEFTDTLFQDGGSGEFSPDAEERRQFRYDSITRPVTLHEHLLRQLDSQDLPPLDRALALQIVNSLDARGYLEMPLADIAQGLGAGMDDAQRSLAIVQALDPTGVGARDLAECLLLQLRAEGLDDTLAADILRETPDLLARRDLPRIAKAFHCSIDDVRFALGDLKSLQPAPGAAFAPAPIQYIAPEATVGLVRDRYVVLELEDPRNALPDPLPSLRINRQYRALSESEKTGPELRRYLREHIRSAEQLCDFVRQRRETTLRVAAEIVARQQDFFRYGVEKLHPMTMGEIAEAMGVNETTISRAVRERWMKTPRGLLEFRSFFTGGLPSGDGKSVSNRSVQERIRQLVAAEDPEHPLTDDAIVEALRKEGITIARRTVVKYRGILHIPNYSARRR